MAYEKWIDIAKGIGIFLVIVGHSHCPPFLQTIIYSFHMPLFFFLSGYTFHYDKYKLNKSAFVTNKFYRLVVPYFFANFLILLILSLKDSLTMNPLKMPIPVTRSLIGIAYGNGAPLNPPSIFANMVDVPTWFLLCLFCAYLLFYLVAAFHEKYGLTLSYIVVFLTVYVGFAISKFIYLPWGIDIAFISMIFMFTAYIMNHYGAINTKSKVIPEYFSWFLLLFISILLNGRVDMNLRNYSNLFLFVIGGLSGTFIMIGLAKELSRYTNVFTEMSEYLGKKSLVILCYHLFTPIFILNSIPFIHVREMVSNSLFLSTLNILVFSIFTVVLFKKIPFFRRVHSM